MGKHAASRKSRAGPAPNRPRPAMQDIWIGAGLFATVLLVYAQVRHFEFITLDDLSSEWVLGPMTRRGITLPGLWWALTSGAENWWFPLTRFSHMLDCELFGLNSGAHHFTSVLLHAVSTVVLFAFFRRATGDLWPSAFVAFVFAMHPLHVESVAWVAERKDVLCAFFWMWTLWFYLRYVQRPDRRRYAVVALFLCLSLMSKSMAVSLPCVLVLADFWPLRRPISIAASIREKLPLFALAAAAGVITIICAHQGGAGVATFPLAMRLENALIRYVLYVAKTFWPANLAVYYPYPASIPAWQPLMCAVVLAGMTVAALLLRKHRYLPAGWLWYLGTMALVIGVVQSGWQAWADRYMYIPMIGISVMLAWGIAEASRCWPRTRTPVTVIGVGACLAMAAAAYNQLAYWQNTETLFARALAVTDRNYMAHNSLGAYLLDRPGRLPEAIGHFEQAIRIDPRNAVAQNDLGLALLRMDRLPEAREHLETAVRLKPDSFESHNNLAAALLRTPGRMDDALAEFQAAVRIRPDSAEAHYNLGAMLSKMPGRMPEAVQHLQAALQINPDFDTHYALAVALLQIPGRTAEARVQLQAALRLKPDSQEARQLLRQIAAP
ncbi:MAG TPA: tetratricopeptide repeat protein [Candidatus Acidoferrales bacterium]|nr:tetratricopeptide repeat protein [Candidatus Acidoferrales bacterium]